MQSPQLALLARQCTGGQQLGAAVCWAQPLAQITYEKTMLSIASCTRHQQQETARTAQGWSLAEGAVRVVVLGHGVEG